MKKIKINNQKNKYRSSSVLNLTNPSKIYKRINQNKTLRHPSTISIIIYIIKKVKKLLIVYLRTYKYIKNRTKKIYVS
jgi:hypothetical protein